jgi:hypothetical protein
MQIEHQSAERNPDVKLAIRISKLLRLLLLTDKPGEAVATAAALNRTLAAAGLSPHDLGDAIEAGLVEVTTLVPHDDDGEDWRSIARFCCLHKDEISEKERDFVSNILRYQTLTEKQSKWLADIEARLLAGGAQ